MTPDMADAHETARARDAYRTRTHTINPDAGEFTPLDFHREWLHVMDTQHPHTPQETDMPNNQRRHREQMGVLNQIHDTLKDIAGNTAEQYATLTEIRDRHDELKALLTEIRDRLPERVEVKVAPFDPDLIARNLAAIKHEIETPMREHGECCEPAEVTEDQPVGTRIVDRDGDVWERREGGWALWFERRQGWMPDIYPGATTEVWGAVQDYAPLRLATPADLARVGIEVEPAPMAVHNHGTEEGAGLACRETHVDGALRGECLADDLPGEPVEPGDLRAGDKVEFTWEGERITCHLVSDGTVLHPGVWDSDGWTPIVVTRDRKWRRGISDVRLIERAPREDEHRDDTEQAALVEEGVRQKRRAIKAEAERDALRERLDALRADLRRDRATFTPSTVTAILVRDDERATKGEQR